MIKQLIKTTVLAMSLISSSTVLAELVNINTADIKVLQEQLKGVGEKKAQAIIDYRTEKGGFKTLEEIQEVKGIGPKLFEKIKADISLTEGLGSTQTSTPAPTNLSKDTPPSEATKQPAKVDKTTPKS